MRKDNRAHPRIVRLKTEILAALDCGLLDGYAFDEIDWLYDSGSFRGFPIDAVNPLRKFGGELVVLMLSCSVFSQRMATFALVGCNVGAGSEDRFAFE